MDFFNHTRRKFANNEIDLADLKVMLVGAGYTFAAAQTAITAAAAEQVSGSGWAAGGVALSNPVITTTGTNEATLDADDISETASGGDIGPAAALVIYANDEEDDPPLFHYAFPTPQTAGEGTDFNINWHEDGIHVWANPA